jgi:hypothetical protein
MKQLILIIAAATLLLPGCSNRQVTGIPDGAVKDGHSSAQHDGQGDGTTHLDQTSPDTVGPPVCPKPCAPGTHACVAALPNTTKGMCLRKCTSHCGSGDPAGTYSMCHVDRGGTAYCMHFCSWKDSTYVCPDPNQICVDAYLISGHRLKPGYDGSTVCVPK